MRIVVQRVSEARVTVEGSVVGAIGPGLLLLVAAGPTDTEASVVALAGKVARLRIFPDDAGKMNRPALDAGAAMLVVSQFTLYAELRKGTRPNFAGAAPPDVAAPLIARFAAALRAHGLVVAEGRFGAYMQVALVNDGPVTLILNG
jgi:D-tyrosyl-tRNA(Tyr) deacylase